MPLGMPAGCRRYAPTAVRVALTLLGAGLLVCVPLQGLDRPEITFQVFQFSADQIPRIDGDTKDWDVVPSEYAITMDRFTDDNGKHQPNPQNLDVKIRVGWVKGLNRLYFLYEASDDYWDFALPGLHNDTFEIIVDGDASGGPLIDQEHGEFWTPERVGRKTAEADDRITVAEAHWAIHGVHAQNYHVFTPAAGKDWAMAWSAAAWIKEFPYANAKVRYDFKAGGRGTLALEFWVTAFDYAGPEGPQRAVESMLRENKIIGLSMVVIDYDDEKTRQNNGFWRLSTTRTAYGHAAELCAFKLMPLEPRFLPELEARWSFHVVDAERRVVTFRDESVSGAKIEAWKWEFGDGATSTEQHPTHTYAKPGNFVTILEVTTADGKKARRSKVWDVQVR